MWSDSLSWARKFAWIMCVGAALVADLNAAQQKTATPRTTLHFEALPLMRSRQNHLLVRAYINGKPAWFGVDACGTVSAIAVHRRLYFRLKPSSASSSLPAQ